MDSLNNILSRVGSALGFGGNKSQQTAPQQTTPQQTTASGQGSNMMELMPQSLAELPQVTQKQSDLSPRAFDAQNLIDNLGGYLASGPTTNYDFLGNLQNQQTPQGVFNQQTQQVVDNQGQVIGTPNQVISSPTQVNTPNLQIQTPNLQIQTPEPIVPEISSQTNAGAALSNQLDQSFTLSSQDKISTDAIPDEIPEALKPVPQSTTTIGEGMKKDEDKYNNSFLSSIIKTTAEVDTGLRGMFISLVMEDGEQLTYNALDDQTKILLNPQYQREYGKTLSKNPESIESIGSYIGVRKIAEIYSNDTLTNEQKDQAASEEFPGLPSSKAREIAQSVIDNTEVKARRVAKMQGIDFDNINAVADSNEIKSKRYLEQASPMIDGLLIEFRDILLDSPYKLSISDISDRGNGLSNEVYRQVRQIANGAASYNTMQESNTAIYGNSIPQLTDEIVGKLIERQLDTTKWSIEASANGLDSSVVIKNKLEQLGYEGVNSLRHYTMAPLEEWARNTPDSPEKDIMLGLIITSMSLDDGIKAMEVSVNLVNHENGFRRANALLQGTNLLRLGLTKSGGGVLGGVMSQSLNAEQDLSRVDFTEDGVNLLAHYATDLAQITPELAIAIQDLIIGNAIGGFVANGATKAINYGKTWANVIGKVPLIAQIGAKVPKPIANLLNYGNKVFQGGVRNVPRFADELAQEVLVSSSLGAFNPGTNSSEEDGNIMLGIAFAGIVAAVPSVWRVTTNGLPNTYGVYGVTDEMTREMIKNTNYQARLRQTENDRYLKEVKDLQSQGLLTEAEAIAQATEEKKWFLSPEEKQAINTKVRNEAISLDDIAAAKSYHQNALDRVEILRRSDPEAAKTLERKAWVHNKVNEIYNTALNSTDEATKLSDLMKTFNVTGDGTAAFTTLGQLRDQLNTIMPLRIGSQTSNPYNVSLDAFNINSSAMRGYTIPNELKEQIGDIDFYKPLSEEQFAKLEKMGINKESEGLFNKVDDGYVLTQEGINKTGILDPNNTILKSQIPLSKEDQIIIDIVRQTSGDDVAQLVKNNNVIDNIYNSIKTIC